MLTNATRLLLALALVPACVMGSDAGGSDIEDGEHDMLGGKSDSIVEGTAQAKAILALVNDTATDVERLDDDVQLSTRVAENIIAGRGTGYATLAALDAVAYVGPTALAALLEYATAEGYLTTGGGGDAQLSASWSIQSVSGAAAGCPSGFDTISIVTQKLDSQGNASGAPAIDLFNCADDAGNVDLAAGTYRVWADVTSHDGLNKFASSNAADVVIAGVDQSIAFSILTDGGYFSLGWTLEGGNTHQSLTCSDVADISGVELASTVAGSTQLVTDIWDCDDYFGVTAGLAAGSYTLSVSALDGSNQALGVAPASTHTIESRNKVTHIGDVTIAIDGR